MGSNVDVQAHEPSKRTRMDGGDGMESVPAHAGGRESVQDGGRKRRRAHVSKRMRREENERTDP